MTFRFTTAGESHGRGLVGVLEGIPAGLPVSAERINVEPQRRRQVTRPRPGHADLAGSLKYDRRDARDILERASARETVARVACGAVCKILLEQFDVDVGSHVVELGGVVAESPVPIPQPLN